MTKIMFAYICEMLGFSIEYLWTGILKSDPHWRLYFKQDSKLVFPMGEDKLDNVLLLVYRGDDDVYTGHFTGHLITVSSEPSPGEITTLIRWLKKLIGRPEVGDPEDE